MFYSIYHIYATMLAIMDLVVSDNRTTVGPNLDSCQGIPMDVISLNKAPTITKNINTSLVAIKNGIAPVFEQNKIHFIIQLHLDQFLM